MMNPPAGFVVVGFGLGVVGFGDGLCVVGCGAGFGVAVGFGVTGEAGVGGGGAVVTGVTGLIVAAGPACVGPATDRPEAGTLDTLHRETTG